MAQRNQKGVTLIELLIVMIIIAILSVVIFISMTASIEDAEQASVDDFKANVNTALKQALAATIQKEFKDSTGAIFDPCEVPAYSAFLENYFGEGALDGTGVNGSCYSMTVTFADGFCLNPAATAGGGNTFTATPCTTHDDCTGISWMGCGSFAGFTVTLAPAPDCATAVALEGAGTPLPTYQKNCVWVCEGTYATLDCSNWVELP